jgi:PiT family inorganic phosphate transporter
MALILCVVVVALLFEYINGFHDTANSIATVVSTKVLTARQAVVMAAATNLIGALWGTAVAKTIASGLVDSRVVSQQVLICALVAAIVWNLVTWYWGLPSSSSHALVGGLVGAALAAARSWHVIIWSQPDKTHWYLGKGLLWKVVLPMFTSPAVGFVLGFLIMGTLYSLLRNWRPRSVNALFGKAQMLSAAGMGFMHGTNDAQKTMGIVALALVAGTADGKFAGLPQWLSFLHTPTPAQGHELEIAVWIKVLCALVMAAGTAAGGWRIIRTLGATASCERLCGGDHVGRSDWSRVTLRYSGLNNAQHFCCDHGGWLGKEVQCFEMDGRRKDGLGLAANNPNHGARRVSVGENPSRHWSDGHDNLGGNLR